MSQRPPYRYVVYILLCSDRTLYAGYTTDLKKRLQAHNSGKGSKYVRARLPAKVVYHEKYKTKSEALKREYAIKQMSRDEKLALVFNLGS